MPLAVAVPWVALVPTATEVAVPPVMFSAIGLLVLPYATVALTALATGGGFCTLIVSDVTVK